MNVYRVTGTFRLWNDPTLPRDDFNRVVLANRTEEAIQICKDRYREAEIISTLLKDEDVLLEGEKAE